MPDLHAASLAALEATRAPEHSEAPAVVVTEAVVSFRVGDVWLAVPASCVDEFCDVGKIIPVPRAPAHIPGLMNVRGHAVPLLDLQRFLLLSVGTRRDERARQRVLVVRAAGMRVGLLCDQVRSLEQVPRTQMQGIEGFANTPLGPYTQAQLTTPTMLAPLLDVATLLEAARVNR